MVHNEKQRIKASRVASTILSQVGQDIGDRFQKPWMKHREVGDYPGTTQIYEECGKWRGVDF